VAVLHHLQHEPGRHGECGDERNVDAPPQDHDCHGEAENAEHCHVLQQRQHIVGREEPRQEHRERDEKDGEDNEDDLLLSGS
jgi:hypothetical protein